MSVIALVPSAGSGRRMDNKKNNKPFLELKGKPLLVYTLSRLDRSALIDTVILIVKAGYIEEAKRIVEDYGIRKVTDIVPGGGTRTQSVANGLAQVEAADEDIILIHDGVRPFVKSAERFGAAVMGIPCTSTIKKINEEDIIEKTVDRKYLYEAQTPQAFRYGIIKEAYEKFKGQDATDDSCFVTRLGHDVHIVSGDRNNIKITLLEDLKLAEAILDSSK
jgi:2-C-methyl-D-erythritol 4-phosphate cytidylyltransferase